MFCVWLCLFTAMLFLRIPEAGESRELPEDPAREEAEKPAQAPAAGKEVPASGEEEPEEGYVPPVIRVLLTDSQGGYLHREVEVSSGGGIRLGDTQVTVPPGQSEKITAADGRFIDGRILLEPEDASQGILLESVRRAQGVPAYQGSLEIYRTEQGLYIVNEVDLETYLKYVVPSEMPASCQQEALRAQAVCARTYAVKAVADQGLEEYHAHVDDTVSYQVYNNLSRQQTTDQAVDDTAGQIMTFQGEPITAYFFSTSCGYTSTDEVWSGEAGAEYLKSVYLGSDSPENVQSEEVFANFIRSRDDSDYEAEDAWYRWQTQLPAEILSRRLAEQGVGEVTDLKVLRRSSGGAVTALEVSGTEGSTVIENEYAIREFLSVKGIPVTKNDDTVTEEMDLLPSAYFICSSVYEGEAVSDFLFLGGGYGHGVGMSQNGAEHLASEGYSWQQILRYFYREITLETIR